MFFTEYDIGLRCVYTTQIAAGVLDYFSYHLQIEVISFYYKISMKYCSMW